MKPNSEWNTSSDRYRTGYGTHARCIVFAHPNNTGFYVRVDLWNNPNLKEPTYDQVKSVIQHDYWLSEKTKFNKRYGTCKLLEAQKSNQKMVEYSIINIF